MVGPAAAGGRAFSALLLLQLLSRGVNFALGTLLARSLGPQWYALANVQLQLVTSSTLFLSKEGLRRSCQRVYPGGGGAPGGHPGGSGSLCDGCSGVSTDAGRRG